MRAANPPSVSQTPTETRVSSLSEQRRQRGGGQAAGSSFSPAASPGQVEACRLWGWSEGVGLRGLGERQALTTCRVPSLRLRGPVSLGWGVSGRATGHDPQQEQALFAGAGGWEPGCMHIPRTPRITHTHTHPRVCSPLQSHTQATSRGQSCSPTSSQLYSLKQLWALIYHHTRRLPPGTAPWGPTGVISHLLSTRIQQHSHRSRPRPRPGHTAPSECPPPSSTRRRCTRHTERSTQHPLAPHGSLSVRLFLFLLRDLSPNPPNVSKHPCPNMSISLGRTERSPLTSLELCLLPTLLIKSRSPDSQAGAKPQE